MARIVFPLRELDDLRGRFQSGSYDTGAIAGELGRVVSDLRLETLTAYRLPDAVRIAAEIDVRSASTREHATSFEQSASAVTQQILRAWRSQVDDPSVVKVLDQLQGLAEKGKDVGESRLWLQRSLDYAKERGLWSLINDHKLGGHYDRAIGSGLLFAGASVSMLANRLGYEGIGQLADLQGKVGSALYKGHEVLAAGGVAVKVGKLSVAGAVLSWADVAYGYGDFQEARRTGDTAGQWAYGGKVMQAAGSTLLLVPIFPVQAAGAVLLGAGVAVEGVAWLSKPENLARVQEDVAQVVDKVGDAAADVGRGAVSVGKKVWGFLH